MKECPKCQKSWPDDFTYCKSCGYYFPVGEMSDQTEYDGYLKGCRAVFLWGLTLASLVFSGIAILAGFAGDFQWAAIGLFCGGVSLYPLITTKGFTRWNGFTTEDRGCLLLPIIMEIVWVCVWGLVLMLAYYCCRE